MKRYKVVHPHRSNYPDPIVLVKGDFVIYGREDTEFPNWIFVKQSILKSVDGYRNKY